ncbi:MAG: hypothetical protein AAFR33_10835 [Pseudomonadota bacterium]
MTPRDADSLAWSLDFAARRLDGAWELAGGPALGSHMLRGVWRATCRELRYLEMFVRRLLVFMAGQITLAPTVKRPAPDGPMASMVRPTKQPAFAVFDPLLSVDAILKRYGSNGVDDAQLMPPDWPLTKAHPVVSAAGIAARFAALQRVLEDPGRHARRLARALDRQRGQPGRATPIRLGHAPQLARGGPLDLMRSAYFEAERLALTFLNRGASLPVSIPRGPP